MTPDHDDPNQPSNPAGSQPQGPDQPVVIPTLAPLPPELPTTNDPDQLALEGVLHRIPQVFFSPSNAPEACPDFCNQVMAQLHDDRQQAAPVDPTPFDYEFISAYVDGELASCLGSQSEADRLCDAFEQHLHQLPACQLHLGQLDDLTSMLRSYMVRTEEGLQFDISAAVMAALAQEERRSDAVLIRLLKPALTPKALPLWATGIAAAVALLFMVQPGMIPSSLHPNQFLSAAGELAYIPQSTAEYILTSNEQAPDYDTPESYLFAEETDIAPVDTSSVDNNPDSALALDYIKTDASSTP